MSLQRQSVSILGSTGSVGVNTLKVIAAHPQRYQVYALTANKNVAVLRQQCLEFQPRYAVMADALAATKLREELSTQTKVKVEVLSGVAGLIQVASCVDVDCVMAAIVGGAGLLPSLAAAKAGKKILLANKEALVMAGDLFMQAVNQANGQLIPIDSEHNAIFQCLPINKEAQFIEKQEFG